MNNSKQNIQFNYLYRDSSNYKLFRNEIFSNPDKLSIADIRNKVKDFLIDGEFFEPAKWQLRPLGFEDWIDDLDHFWNEFESMQATSEKATTNKTITEFLSGISRTDQSLHRRFESSQ